MERVPRKSNLQVIRKTLEELPVGFRKLLGNVPFVIDTCPNWAGLTIYKEVDDGRAISEICCVVYDYHQLHF
ncbi:MAG TPA: hypothetical protein VEP90_11360, partial [Methylomirabilota bacterium]|nr:hypothetical protein [Methylomirabilota bacterium]